MSYYKILTNGVVTDANDVFLRWQAKHKMMIVCPPEQGQFIQSSDQESIYRVPWLLPAPEDVAAQYMTADAVEITEDEYKALRAVLDAGEVPAEEPNQEQQEPQEVVVPGMELDYLRSLKIKEMSEKCRASIISGVDVTLSDGAQHHFSLTVEDQLNLVSLSALTMQGQEQIPYHADGEPCRFFSSEDFQAVVAAATEWKTMQESYFNSLKVYIQSVDDAVELAAIEYGAAVPAEYWSTVLEALYQSGD